METIWLMGDHLSIMHPGLAGGPRPDAVVLFIESKKRGHWLRYHQQKLVLVYSAMRHFAADLRKAGWVVDYHHLDETPDFLGALQQHVARHQPKRMLLMEPNDWASTQAVEGWRKRLPVPIELLPNNFFLCQRGEFRRWAEGRKQLRMELHYRRMRVEHDVLMEPDGTPTGGRWNLDTENRQTFAAFQRTQSDAATPTPREVPDGITREVIEMVAREFSEHPGRAADFWLPVDRAGALRWLQRFVAERLPRFGDFEDTMSAEHPVLFHSVLSPLLNLGLLAPRECLEAAVQAFRAGHAPLNSVEGFVRQILGWREFVNGVYWLRMPDYVEENALGASRPLPSWFYTAETEMRCLRTCLRQTLATGYNHHIQRLMVLGNFCLLAEVNPREALRWFLEMYVDAFDWVMAANVIGMVLHADGGFMASKPYAAGGAYISKMSDYCRGCAYDPAKRVGAGACPFNFLYWDFYARHAERFSRNPRIGMAVKTWNAKSATERSAILGAAKAFLDEHVPRRPGEQGSSAEERA